MSRGNTALIGTLPLNGLVDRGEKYSWRLEWGRCLANKLEDNGKGDKFAATRKSKAARLLKSHSEIGLVPLQNRCGAVNALGTAGFKDSITSSRGGHTTTRGVEGRRVEWPLFGSKPQICHESPFHLERHATKFNMSASAWPEPTRHRLDASYTHLKLVR
ncbi:hypothetical protein K474DRAFT_1696527 [Panus rudis PR-1116 ss-1]|nr:hypothetical protein K474DRAFT_1696527 [Panus rudis PR-1116 ss-1]